MTFLCFIIENNKKKNETSLDLRSSPVPFIVSTKIKKNALTNLFLNDSNINIFKNTPSLFSSSPFASQFDLNLE